MKSTNFFFSLLFLFIYIASINAQGIYLPALPPAKIFNISPVADFDVEINGINGGHQNVVPYDFYAAFNCEVKHTLDSVFNYTNDPVTVTIESNAPCYFCIYGKDFSSGTYEGFHFYKISQKPAGSMYYQKTITFSGNDLTNELNRFFITGNKCVLKKLNKDNPSIIGDTTIVLRNTLSTESTKYSIRPYCTVTFYNHVTGETSSINGEFDNNMYLLSGDIYDNHHLMWGSYENAILPHEPFTIFTTNSTTDVEMFIINSNDSIIGHCNNYFGQSLHDWAGNARIDLSGNDSIKGIILIPYCTYIDQEDYFYDDDYIFTDTIPDGHTDLYLGCKFYDFTHDGGASVFPNLNRKDAIESDYFRTLGQGIEYNCFAWALGYYSLYFNHNYEFISTVSGLINYYSQEGYTTNGANEDNSEIDIWEKNGECTHASIRSYTNSRSYGYAWESKDGFGGGRFMHPRYALVNDNPGDIGYGHVVAHMIKDTTSYISETVYENIDFSAEEISEICSIKSNCAYSEINKAQELYFFALNSIMKSHISNPCLYKKYIPDYKNLLDNFQKNIATKVFILEKLSEGDFLSALVLLDNEQMDLLAKKRIQDIKVAKLSIDSISQRLIRTDFSNAVLYGKYILNNILNEDKFDMAPATLSNDVSKIMVSSIGNRLQITINTDRNSIVSLAIASSDGIYLNNLLEKNTIDEGKHDFSVQLPHSGIYGITYIENGHVYMKNFYF